MDSYPGFDRSVWPVDSVRSIASSAMPEVRKLLLVYDFQYKKERRPITLRVKERGEHLAREGKSGGRGR